MKAVPKGDTRSLDNGTYGVLFVKSQSLLLVNIGGSFSESNLGFRVYG